jgi:predicted neutral ceramidase superfamily lipid hydrolase
MSEFNKILESIPDISQELIPLDQIAQQYNITNDDPMLYVLYLRFNETCISNKEKETIEKIIVKLQRNITIINNINLEKFKDSSNNIIDCGNKIE